MAAFDILGALPAEWQAEIAEYELVPITSGMSGAAVFRMQGGGAVDRYLKIGVGAQSAHIRREAERTRWLTSTGLRVPTVIMELNTPDVSAVIMAAVVGQPVSSAGLDNATSVIAAIARAFAALHALPAASCPFDETLTVRLARAEEAVRRGEVDAAHFDARNAGTTPRQLYERLVANVPTRHDCVVVHGDATLSNLLLADGAIGFVDCGHCGRSDRYVDLALLREELVDHFGARAWPLFRDHYGGPRWNRRKAEFYRDLYELF
jgi:aminoglycoside 3'-phosphotransferase-2